MIVSLREVPIGNGRAGRFFRVRRQVFENAATIPIRSKSDPEQAIGPEAFKILISEHIFRNGRLNIQLLKVFIEKASPDKLAGMGLNLRVGHPEPSSYGLFDPRCPEENFRTDMAYLIVGRLAPATDRYFEPRYGSYHSRAKRSVGLLMSGNVDQWNKEHLFLRGKAHFCDLSGLWYPDAKLEGVNFSFVKLNGCHMPGTTLKRADLYVAFLDGAFLEAAIFDGARLENTELRSSKLSRASFIGAGLAGTYFTGSDLKHAAFDKSFFCDPHFSDADLSFATMTGITLHTGGHSIPIGRSFRGANLLKAKLDEQLRQYILERFTVETIKNAGTVTWVKTPS